MTPEELERVKSHVLNALIRVGVNPDNIDDKSLEATARFVYEERLAPTDYSMTLIHRAIKWSLSYVVR